MLVCVSSHSFARETAGAARTRLSLRPLFSGGPNEQAKPRAEPAARRRRCVFRRSIDFTSPACGEEGSRQASSPRCLSARGSVNSPPSTRNARGGEGSGVGGVSADSVPERERVFAAPPPAPDPSPPLRGRRGRRTYRSCAGALAYTSTTALSELSWMNSRRGSTMSPISLVKMSSASSTSLIFTCSSERSLVSSVVCQSCSGFISPRPL